MAQHDDRHLTTEQLSAFLDKQLSPQEQAEYNVHLQTCQHCQQALADLKQTVALLHALPQPALPRSFVLPASQPAQATQTAPTPMTPMQEQRRHHVHPITTTTRRTRIHRGGSFARQSIRVLSTLAAVIGIVFLLSSFLVSVQHEGNTSTATGSSAGTTKGPATQQPQVQGVGTPQTQASPAIVHTPNITAPGRKQTPTSTATPQNRNQTHQNSARSPAIDLNSPQVHLGLGAILLLIGILGVVLTRKRRE